MRMIRLPNNKTINNRQKFFDKQPLAVVEPKALVEEVNETTLQLNIYDEIGFWGITAKDVRQALDNSRKKGYKDLVVNINSPGGDVFDGIAIFNDLFNFPANVRVEITGIAASIATVIAMAGDEIVMAENATFMVHNAWGVGIGNKNDMTALSEILGKIDESIAATYAAKTNLTQEESLALMNEETWMSADEAYDKGFVTEVRSIKEAKNILFDLSVFNKVPGEVKQRIENDLHNAGYSRREAKAAVSQGFSALGQRDVARDSPDQRDVEKETSVGYLASIRKLTEDLKS